LYHSKNGIILRSIAAIFSQANITPFPSTNISRCNCPSRAKIRKTECIP
jgi:hypothetical protein